MYRATTPTHTFKLPIVTDVCDVIQVSYKQNGKEILKKECYDGDCQDGMDLDDEYVIVRLTQEETKMFKKGEATVQIRVLTYTEDVMASPKFHLAINDVNNDEVLVYDGGDSYDSGNIK